MKQYKRLLCVVLAVVLAVTLCACHLGELVEELPDVPSLDPVTTETTAGEPEVDTRNIITGLDDMGESQLTRPVGVMVANNDFIQDEQVGLSKADMWVEAETEGGITRIMAVFAGSDRVPESIGPVRSARSPFFHTVEALGLAYAHAGGSYTALAMIANSNIADLDVNSAAAESKYAWRDNNYPHDYEYRLRTSAEGLTQYMTDKGYKQYQVMDWPWTFGDKTGDTAVNTISIKMSGAQTIGFAYDSGTGLYQKTNGSSRTAHKDIDGGALAATNVLVLFSDKYWENDTTIDFYLQSGQGYVFSDGTMRRFDWSRDSEGFHMQETDGSQLTLNTGKTYMCIVATEYESAMTYTAE